MDEKANVFQIESISCIYYLNFTRPSIRSMNTRHAVIKLLIDIERKVSKLCAWNNGTLGLGMGKFAPRIISNRKL